ncbi:MAG: GNAT family N-acetyltransferase [Proteobacteria bacterium]|nr:GNAT family N-acetyltransferase [Pseudomonadota bacterium]
MIPADQRRPKPLIRAMAEADGPAVFEIYRQGIATGHATFEKSVPQDWNAWFASRLMAGRLVAEQGGRVVGWSALSAVSARAVYAGVGEVSVYVADAAHGGGVGRALLGGLVEASEAAGVWTLQASIFPKNQASVTLHQRFGFRLMGRREKIAWMSYGPMADQWRDTVIMERRSTTVGCAAPPG